MKTLGFGKVKIGKLAPLWLWLYEQSLGIKNGVICVFLTEKMTFAIFSNGTSIPDLPYLLYTKLILFYSICGFIFQHIYEN